MLATINLSLVRFYDDIEGADRPLLLRAERDATRSLRIWADPSEFRAMEA